jgi:lipopolysaccharide/colanic/teichoic acid biosynthesis glycosyltransferase
MGHTAEATFEAGLVEAVRQREHRYRPIKRALDLCCTIAVLPLAISVMLLLAAAIRIDSPGPIFFRHQRLGWHGRPFTLYKFRTMRREALPYAPHPRRSDDARVTRVGRFLRRTNLDELPQLFNILRDDMSLVGPRPEMPYIVATYTAKQRLRLLAKPGLTGLWQISPHRGSPIHEHMEHDTAYLHGMGLWLDLAILLRTLPLLVRGDKAGSVGGKDGAHG